MKKAFTMRLDGIQPSQLFISSKKLSEALKSFDSAKPDSIEPMPVKKLGGEVVFVDGHTRAFAAFLHGLSEVSVYWETDELDWDAYKICVEWCREEGIQSIADLKQRVVSQKEYEVVWLERCRKMQEELEA